MMNAMVEWFWREDGEFFLVLVGMWFVMPAMIWAMISATQKVRG